MHIKYAHLYDSFKLEYESGKNIYKIAEKYGVHPETVRQGIHKAGGKTLRRARKYFINANRERALKFLYGVSFEDVEYLWKKQKGMCLWCRAPLPKDVLKCVIDHIGGKQTFGQREKVRGLCCPTGHCNRLAGLVESGRLSRNSLFYAFVNRVRFVLRTNKGAFLGSNNG